MPKFHVRETFEVSRPELFVMAGTVTEGVIRAGMFIYVPLNGSTNVTARIHSIEFLTPQADETRLCFKLEAGEMGILRALDVKGKTLEVTQNSTKI